MARSSSSWSKQQQQQLGGHISTVHQRLYHSLNLGLRSNEDGRKKVQFLDAEIQRLVIRSIDSFLDCISGDTLKYPLVKGSIPDIVRALEGILHVRNEATLSLASNMVVKMIHVLPNSILQTHLLDLIHPMASLLPSHQLQVAISCATALNSLLSNLSSRKEEEVWKILKDTNTVVHISKYIQDFSAGNKPMEYFEVLISLLSKILSRWPSSRFCIGTDVKLMDVLGAIVLAPDSSVKVAVLQLYTALGLCGTGAQKILEREDTVMHIVKHCMTSSNSVSVQMEGFRLAQNLALNEHNFLKMIKICCEPIVIAIINVMSSWSSHLGKIQMPLLMDACHLSLITQWSGNHQKYFWKLGIEKALLNLLLNKGQPCQSQHKLSVEEQIALAQRGLKENFLLYLRPHIWDILGGLAAHCPEDFKPQMHESEISVNLLIICACLEFVDSVRNSHQLFLCDPSELCQNESVCKSVLMMIYSPSRYVSDQARFVLSEILSPNDKEFPNYVLAKLNKLKAKSGMLETLRSVINLMSLACFSALPQYREEIINADGIKTLVAFLKWLLSHDIRMNRSTLVPNLLNHYSKRTCCLVRTEDWDGEYAPLFYCLWNIDKLMMHHSSLVGYFDASLVSELQRICADLSAPGPRWYAASILGYFGFYGFPNKFGKKIGEALNENELSDVKLLIADSEPLSVHSVILFVRCPSLLPPKAHHLNDRPSNDCNTEGNVDWERSKKEEVRLSAYVDRKVLLKLLEFVYYGHLKAEPDLVKKLKILARHCNLQYLLQLLCHKNPSWGTPFPSFDFTYALGPTGCRFSDVVLEGKADDNIQWRCNTCTSPVPHMHVHKVLLSFTSWYFRVLFQSGFKESHSETIKVPVSWKALEKLVKWFYSDELPKPLFDCSWDNLDTEAKLAELHPYLELCWLVEPWCLDDVHKECTKVVLSCLDTTKQLAINTIQIAAELSLWELAEAAAHHIAPMYQHLRNRGELDELDEDLIDMVRVASVRLSQEGGGNQ